MTTDPLAWVRAEMDEVEKVARAAYGVMWQDVGGWLISEDMHIAEVDDGPTLAHIARHDPAAVLRRIAADRKLLDLHAESDFPYNPEDGPGDYSWTARCDGCYEAAPCTTVRLIAEGWGWTPDE